MNSLEQKIREKAIFAPEETDHLMRELMKELGFFENTKDSDKWIRLDVVLGLVAEDRKKHG